MLRSVPPGATITLKGRVVRAGAQISFCEVEAQAGDRLLVMINGVGSTTLMEQYLVLNGVKKALDAKDIGLARAIAGEFLTVQEMGGFQMFAA